MGEALTRVAVVVLNLNGLERTRECLEGLRVQTCPDVDVVVVDNGSQDGSGEQLAREAPWAQHVSLPLNLGYAGGNNRGLEVALQRGADQVMVLNNDVVLEPDCVERLVAHVHAGDTVAGPISYQHGTVDTIDLATLCLDAADWTVSTPWRGEAHPRPASPSVLGTDYVTGSAVMAPAPLWRRLGGFYEPYFLTWEDTEFGVRARRLGYRAIVDPEAVAWHRGSATFGGTFTPVYRYYHTRNHLLFVRRNVPAWVRVRAYRRAWHRLRLERRWQAEYGGDEGGRQAEAIRWAMRDFVLGRFGRLRRRI